MRVMAGSKWLASIALMFWSVSCASYTPKCSSFAGVPRSPGPLDSLVFVIGDAGGPPERSRPILTQVQTQAADVARTLGAERTSVIFVGDNIYPNGLPDTNEKGRRDAEERLLAQLKVSESGAPVSFVAGNHDWKGGKRGGLAAVQRQSAYIDEHRGSGDVAMKPPGGCPGPVVENAMVGAILGDTEGRTLLWVGGHEHNLQLFGEASGFPPVLVSGNGMLEHRSL